MYSVKVSRRHMRQIPRSY